MKKGLMLILIVSIALLSGCMQTPKDITLQVDSPLQVTINQEFNINITVKNTADKSQELTCIDIGDEYLKGIAIKSSDPAYKESMHVPLDNTWSYIYPIDIPANGEVKVVFTAVAVKTGDFNGKLDICINGDTNCLYNNIRAIVSD